jgi:hypothetical protein
VPGLVEKYGEDKLLAMVKKKYKEQEEASLITVELMQPGPLGIRFTQIQTQCVRFQLMISSRLQPSCPQHCLSH